MSVPVVPPEIPAVVQPVAAQTSSNLTESSPETVVPIAESPQASLPQQLALSSAAPSSPETFAPEASEYRQPYATDGTAADLGPPISVGYRIRENAPEVAESTPAAPSETADNSVLVASTSLQNLLIPSLTQRQERGSGGARIITQERGGQVQEFQMTLPTLESQPAQELPIPDASSQESPPVSPSPSPYPPVTLDPEDIVEITSDRQEYDQKRGIVTATGNAVMRFSKGVITGDRVQVNLRNRVVVAEGNVALKRGDQTLRGERFEYFFVQDKGIIENASGEIYQPNIARDSAPRIGDPAVLGRPLSDRLLAEQPVNGVSATQGYSFTVGGIGAATPGTSFPAAGGQGTLNRQRFEAAQIEFDGEVWRGRDVRVTNDPFSPPELEVRADTATVRNIGPLQDELVLDNPRLVFDQGLALPLFPRRFVFDRRERDPALFTIGYDERDRGGLFIERSFDIYRSDRIRFQLTPQYLIQRSILDGRGIVPSAFGLRGNLEAQFSDRTWLTAKASLSSLQLDDYENNLRLNSKLNQLLDIFNYTHTLTVEGNYRDRLFNGSLGFQTVQSSFGAVLASPTIPLGDTGILLNYQASLQFINADTDRLDLLPAIRDNNRISLTRYQGAATLTRYFTLWTGEALPATPDQGLRYTPRPVVPNLQLTTQLAGVASYYSNGDTQPTLTGSIGLLGQFGHFSRPFLDYTGFNITYSESIRGTQSPFLFDRIVDTRTLSFGITQQIYGPFRFGFQTQLNLNTGKEISTDYLFEYSRRTHNILLRYNPVLGLAAISLRISDFNWNGSPRPFEGSGVRSVEQGVIRDF
ncbi:DUF3769 domain-containing protein [Oscillatoria sp. FACHB-1406]|uniref:DUF3769 domain-containing protein n=1 Tax=Oscillatoria sp. FACHB-1406 TaxID=2692846 RepID=UPI0016884558|nr:DUF3769 domain-containing protein [Oscillatoria sp. FACHB-1406]MBD2579216.1 DUF3769 domain-containing protein [Oscillatoria sp. FACHB-1406]